MGKVGINLNDINHLNNYQLQTQDEFNDWLKQR